MIQVFPGSLVHPANIRHACVPSVVAQGLSCPLEIGTSHSSFVRGTSLLQEQQIHDQSMFLPFQEEFPLQFPSQLSKVSPLLSKVLEMLSKVQPKLSQELSVTCST